VLAPIAWRTPPLHYGPWESVAGMIAEGLVRRGVEVTLFATLDSSTSADLDGVAAHGYAEDPGMDGRVWEALHVSHALTRSGEFDLMHNHLDWLPLAFSEHLKAPMVTTVHGFSGSGILPAYVRGRSAFVAISASDRSPELEYAATIHHGVELGQLPFRADPGGDLVVFGRIHPDKGTADAIAIARAAGRRLLICGIVQDDRYFAEQVEPHIDGDRVVFLGSVGPARRAEVLGAAAALIHPIHFDEPFGLSVVEAMVCGTPVVAYRRGSMAEVVDDGVTGYLAFDVASAADAVTRAVLLDRAAVHARAASRFASDRMVDDYLTLYRSVIASSTSSRSAHATPMRASSIPYGSHTSPSCTTAPHE
jgi:glycosyltransferase involved in cell wall biosynthesis